MCMGQADTLYMYRQVTIDHIILALKYEKLSTLLWLICYSVNEGSVSP